MPHLSRHYGPKNGKGKWGVGILLVYFRFVRHFCRPTAVFVVAIIVALSGYLNALCSF